ncbi:tRNA pseudouridine(38-40) synthase TruA [Ovoidimarina sediminis]|uniref:tRNA pseudouridine(38-40) synthase TruA n=1 Tax=Ovoidimarina sediminis TaxID=3079856 RepID=UPI00290D6424|nr:tRNA pseudouridine(38-40) synthase TruA [Rhodophyticola sp. MJ-SS7]MDU8942756.1 tRNA pseudouridine(38-40) synthase TruA [Rhodophyticola sp. MJ-SS7]
MPRYALKIEYVGTPFAGWQRQTGPETVQGVLEAALARLEPDVPSVAAAGRTDAGVHAWGQVAQCDLSREWEPFRLSEALNYHLKPHPVAVTAAARVEGDWHARFSAVGRAYVYRIVARRAPLTHDRGLAWRVPQPLDVAAMREAAGHLVGRHDFTTFRSVECQADSPVKTLDRLDISEVEGRGGPEYRFDVAARSFLHNQVRSFVGTLERVGAGKWPPDRVKGALEARDRAACGPVAPPDGLYLAHVSYPDDPFRTSRPGAG